MFRTPQVDDLNVISQVRLVSPELLHDELPLSEAAKQNVLASRDTIKRIIERQDSRLFVVVGPCSIHDPAAALDYGRRLAALAKEVADTIFIVMRVYFEKPRTTVGLERADQRSRSRRLVPHREGPAHRAQAAPRPE